MRLAKIALIVAYSITLIATGSMVSKINIAQADINPRMKAWQDTQGSYIFTDNQTKCLYLVVYSKNGVAVTPMLDENGKPARYR